MTQKPSYARRTITPRPAKVETAADRGQMLQHWLDSHEVLQHVFAKRSKIAMSTLTMYLSGVLDIASMRQATAERFLTELKMSDTEAWDWFKIPTEKRRSFRSFRPPPMGHGEEVRKLIDKELKVPLQGRVQAPIGYSVQFNPAITTEGDVVTETPEGELYVLPVEMAVGRGNILGQFEGVLPAKAKQRA